VGASRRCGGTRAAGTGGRGVSDILDGFGWVFTSSHWTGRNGILGSLGEHLRYSGIALALAILVGLPAGLVIGHTGRGNFAAASVANTLRAVPTFGVVLLLFRWQPRSTFPVLVALTVLAVPSIVLGTAAGIQSLERSVRDAARGIGLSPVQVLLRVELPSALPLVLAGVRSAANQIIATATVAGFGFGLGGLGEFIYSGYGTQRDDVVYGATILVIALVLAVEGAFALAQRRLVSPGVRVRRRVSGPLGALPARTHRVL